MRRQLGRSNLECFVVFVGLLGYCHLELVHGFDRKCVFSPERSQFEYSFPDEIFKGFHGRKEIDDNPSSQDIGGWFRRILWKGKRCGVSVLEGVRVSYSLRGGDISFHSSSFHFGSLDVLARSYSILLAWVVAFQSAIAALFSRREQLFAIAARLVKSDTIAAVKTIQSIFESVDDHGVVDVFKKYPTQELISALYALSRLQAASDIYSSKPIKEFPLCHDEVLLEDLCHYAPFACAAYGWELDLVTAGRLHRGDLHALVRITNIHENDVVQVEWESRANRPAFYIAKDRKRKRLVLSIRGTWSAHDILTDLCCTSEEYFVSSRRHSAHNGMLAAARGVKALAEETIQRELDKNPGYNLLLVGHSLGGSVAAILGQMWAKTFHDVHVYCYGPACVAPMNDMNRDRVVSVMLEGDPFSSLSLGHVADTSKALAHLCDDDDLRTTVLTITDGPLHTLDQQDLRWCKDQMEEIRNHMTGSKLYPPGRLLFLSYLMDRKGPQEIREIPPSVYGELKISARMFDLSRHVPRVYQRRLKSALRHRTAELR